MLMLIDGNNLVHRSKITSHPMTANGEPTHIIYGFFKNLISLIEQMKEEYPQSKVKTVVCWDDGYKHRMELSEAAVKEGIIAKTYKEDRRAKKLLATDVEKLQLEDMKRQANIIAGLLKYTNVMQSRIDDYEGDDVIASMTVKYKAVEDQVVIVTSDKDYYQLLDSNVKIYRPLLQSYYTMDSLKADFGFDHSDQWIDFCSFTGDAGDTIIGVNGFGPVKTLPYIQKFRTVEATLEEFKRISQAAIANYNGDVQALVDAVDAKKCKINFPKIILMALIQEKALHLAKKLKTMCKDLDVSYTETEGDFRVLDAAFKDLSFNTLFSKLPVLATPPEMSDALRKSVLKHFGSNTVDKMVLQVEDKSFMVNAPENVGNVVVEETPPAQPQAPRVIMVQGELF